MPTVKLEIGNGLPGGVSFEVTLTLEEPGNRVTGEGTITQAVNPPTDVHTYLSGTVTRVDLTDINRPILVATLTGYENLPASPPSKVNVKDFKVYDTNNHLEASYSFLRPGNGDQDWQPVGPVAVRVISSTPQPLAQ